MAKLFPMHILGPAPNGKKFFTFLDFNGSEKINRSGSKTDSLCQYFLFLCKPLPVRCYVFFNNHFREAENILPDYSFSEK